MITIKRLNADEAQERLTQLIDLLRDAVDSGASIGFMPPLLAGTAWEYWEKVIQDVEAGSRLLLAAEVNGEIAASVQLALEMRPNGIHRGEVQKLMVHRRYRQQGLGRLLMQTIEADARELGRKLLVLDTRQGDTADGLCRKLGYTEVGIIPNYALDADSKPRSTIFFYKQLTDD
ncbi:MAG: GNAT family N-acetyltransferase [Anaerolineaceae bacterium]|nr:GNAT family N-acetyltransferase [Anaerolineaceae bacterium]